MSERDRYEQGREDEKRFAEDFRALEEYMEMRFDSYIDERDIVFTGKAQPPVNPTGRPYKN